MHTQGRTQAPPPQDTTAVAPPPAGAPAPDLVRHWHRTRRLTALLLLLWFVASFVTVWFAAELRQRFFGWPLSFWAASQGTLLLFLAIVVLYARAMRRIDTECGVEEP